MARAFVSARQGGKYRRPLVGAAGLISVLISSPAAAQSEVLQATPTGGRGGEPASCVVTAQPSEIEGAQALHAECGGRLLILGPATSYRVVPNKRLNATLIDLQFEHERRVLLLSMGADGLPLVEDISGQIALAAGRGPMSEIGDISVEPDEFASTGRISVHADQRAEAARGRIGQIALDEQLARERSR